MNAKEIADTRDCVQVLLDLEHYMDYVKQTYSRTHPTYLSLARLQKEASRERERHASKLARVRN